MPKRSGPRPISSRGEANLARRVTYERECRALSYEALAKAMTTAGCSITKAAIYAIEHGDPPRRITVDELIALADVFEVDDINELLEPMGSVRQRRAEVVAAQLMPAYAAFDSAVIDGLTLYLEYGRLAAGSPDLLEFMNHHIETSVRQGAFDNIVGLDLGDNVTQEEVDALRRDEVELWGKVLRLASKAAGVGD